MNMENSMLDIVKEVFPFKDENLLNEVLYNATDKTVPARTIIISEGSKQYAIPFLVSGMAKGYFRMADGKEVTDCFETKPGEVLAAFYRLHLDSPEYVAEVSMMALTDCTVLYVPVNIINRIATQYIEAILLYNRMLEDSLEWHSDVKKCCISRSRRNDTNGSAKSILN